MRPERAEQARHLAQDYETSNAAVNACRLLLDGQDKSCLDKKEIKLSVISTKIGYMKFC